MMPICRLLLILSVLLYACWVVLVLRWVGVVLLVAMLIKQSRKQLSQLTAHGTARWADESDLVASTGLLLGRLSVQKHLFSKIFDLRVTSLVACLSFWGKEIPGENHPRSQRNFRSDRRWKKCLVCLFPPVDLP